MAMALSISRPVNGVDDLRRLFLDFRVVAV
jgi:hypothetical protein